MKDTTRIYTCPQCGCKFTIFNPADYCYKLYGRYFCGYNCKQLYMKEHNIGQKSKKIEMELKGLCSTDDEEDI